MLGKLFTIQPVVLITWVSVTSINYTAGLMNGGQKCACLPCFPSLKVKPQESKKTGPLKVPEP